MICERTIKDYCCEDPHLIENYNDAINDKTQTWDCHHRLEIDLDKTGKELEELGLYYNRPANELIFLTHNEHIKLHTTGKNNPMYGCCLSVEHKQRISVSLKETLKNPNIRKHRSEIVKGDKNPFYRKTHKNEAKQKIGKVSSKPFKWLTPTGEIKIMNRSNAGRWHPDWIKIGEA